MENTQSILLACPLFHQIHASEVLSLLTCLQTHHHTYEEGEYIFSLGDEVNHIGIVLSGHIELIKENAAGARMIVAFLGPSQLFGEGIVCTSKRIAPLSVRARSQTHILFIPYQSIVQNCSRACNFHTQLITNMLRILGDKNYLLNTKMDLLMLKGIQEKLITYLLGESQRKGSLLFEIPPNRNELAEFLNVSRTSMCRELANLKEEQLLDYHKNSFKLIDLEGLKCKLLKS
ncbi:MAG: Crp/Fnr family transcriptional regulator [Cellulosilyticaceae bacterium]